MENSNISIERLKILEDTCNHFNLQNRNVELVSINCLYYPVSEKTEGCAIGRLITDKELCKRLDLGIGPANVKRVCNYEVFYELPNELQKLGKDFLAELQLLHDFESYWNETGLTESGLIRKNDIKARFFL